MPRVKLVSEGVGLRLNQEELSIDFIPKKALLFSILAPQWGIIHSFQFPSNPIQLILEFLISLYYSTKINKMLFSRVKTKSLYTRKQHARVENLSVTTYSFCLFVLSDDPPV